MVLKDAFKKDRRKQSHHSDLKLSPHKNVKGLSDLSYERAKMGLDYNQIRKDSNGDGTPVWESLKGAC